MIFILVLGKTNTLINTKSYNINEGMYILIPLFFNLLLLGTI